MYGPQDFKYPCRARRQISVQQGIKSRKVPDTESHPTVRSSDLAFNGADMDLSTSFLRLEDIAYAGRPLTTLLRWRTCWSRGPYPPRRCGRIALRPLAGAGPSSKSCSAEDETNPYTGKVIAMDEGHHLTSPHRRYQEQLGEPPVHIYLFIYLRNRQR